MMTILYGQKIKRFDGDAVNFLFELKPSAWSLPLFTFEQALRVMSPLRISSSQIMIKTRRARDEIAASGGRNFLDCGPGC